MRTVFPSLPLSLSPFLPSLSLSIFLLLTASFLCLFFHNLLSTLPQIFLRFSLVCKHSYSSFFLLSPSSLTHSLSFSIHPSFPPSLPSSLSRYLQSTACRLSSFLPSVPSVSSFFLSSSLIHSLTSSLHLFPSNFSLTFPS